MASNINAYDTTLKLRDWGLTASITATAVSGNKRSTMVMWPAGSISLGTYSGTMAFHLLRFGSQLNWVTAGGAAAFGTGA